MPNKKVNNLKHPGSKAAAQEWQESLRLNDLTTREWDNASILAAEGKNIEEIRTQILKDRRHR